MSALPTPPSARRGQVVVRRRLADHRIGHHTILLKGQPGRNPVVGRAHSGRAGSIGSGIVSGHAGCRNSHIDRFCDVAQRGHSGRRLRPHAESLTLVLVRPDGVSRPNRSVLAGCLATAPGTLGNSNNIAELSCYVSSSPASRPMTSTSRSSSSTTPRARCSTPARTRRCARTSSSEPVRGRPPTVPQAPRVRHPAVS